MPTLALIKPSAVAKGYAPAIEALIEEKSFAVVARAEVRREARRSTFTGAPHTQCHPRPPQPRRRGSVKPGRSRGTRGPHMPKRQNWQVTLTVQQAADLYEEHEGTPLFASMCEAMTTGPLIALALEMKDAQAVWLKMLGPDDPAVAKEEVSPTPLPLLT